MNLLTAARDLRRRRGREREALFVAEGIRAVEELLASPLQIAGALIGPSLRGTPRGIALADQLEDAEQVRQVWEITELNDAEFRSAAQTESPQGILAIGRVPERSFDNIPAADRPRLLIL